MSSQPTDTQKAKESASSAIQSVSSTITGISSDPRDQPNYDPNQDPRNFDKDAHGNVFKKGDFKDQLNRAATIDPNADDKKPEGILETVKSYIPGLATKEEQPAEKKETIDPGLPPNRPDHDVQVEQFLRKQYHSKAGDGMPDPSKE